MFIHGGGDWCYYDEIEGGGELYVRIEDGRVVELYLNRNGAEISGGDLRAIRLDRIRAMAKTRPDLMLFTLDWPTPDVHGEVKKAWPADWITDKPTPPPTDATLTPSSPDAGISDDFLRAVAAAYNAAVVRGERPNKALAAQCGYPARTVERWVYLARKGGFLAPTRPGRIG